MRELGLASLAGTPAFIPSKGTKIVEYFDWYFVATSYFGELLLAFSMTYTLGFDPLFTLLVSLFWLSPTTFNLVFLVSQDTFKMNFVQYHMQYLWSLVFIQAIYFIIAWHILQGGFT